MFFEVNERFVNVSGYVLVMCIVSMESDVSVMSAVVLVLSHFTVLLFLLLLSLFSVHLVTVKLSPSGVDDDSKMSVSVVCVYNVYVSVCPLWSVDCVFVFCYSMKHAPWVIFCPHFTFHFTLNKSHP